VGMTESNPTVSQRELANRLRELRTSQGLTVEQVAKKLLCSSTKISRIETGKRRPTMRDIKDLCRLYGVQPQMAAELTGLAEAARGTTWYAGADLDLTPYLGLEEEASAITFFTSYFLHGLLQTEDYARAVIRAIAPRMSLDVLEQRVEARMKRQELLTRPDPPRFRSLMTEEVLHRCVGGPEVMREQLGKLLRTAEDGRATIQVIPFSVGAYAGSDGNFTLLEFANNPDLSDVVYLENLTAAIYLQHPQEIDRYRETVESLRDTALSPRDSLSLIATIRDTHVRSKENIVNGNIRAGER
jgi:transcriptional regulator with XRE-family HTH domain